MAEPRRSRTSPLRASVPPRPPLLSSSHSQSSPPLRAPLQRSLPARPRSVQKATPVPGVPVSSSLRLRQPQSQQQQAPPPDWDFMDHLAQNIVRVNQLFERVVQQSRAPGTTAGRAPPLVTPAAGPGPVSGTAMESSVMTLDELGLGNLLPPHEHEQATPVSSPVKTDIFTDYKAKLTERRFMNGNREEGDPAALAQFAQHERMVYSDGLERREGKLAASFSERPRASMRSSSSVGNRGLSAKNPPLAKPRSSSRAQQTKPQVMGSSLKEEPGASKNIIHALDEQIQLFEQLQDRILRLNQNFLEKQRQMIQDQTEAMHEQALGQMKRWHQVQQEEITFQENQGQRLNRSLRQQPSTTIQPSVSTLPRTEKSQLVTQSLPNFPIFSGASSTLAMAGTTEASQSQESISNSHTQSQSRTSHASLTSRNDLLQQLDKVHHDFVLFLRKLEEIRAAVASKQKSGRASSQLSMLTTRMDSMEKSIRQSLSQFKVAETAVTAEDRREKKEEDHRKNEEPPKVVPTTVPADPSLITFSERIKRFLGGNLDYGAAASIIDDLKDQRKKFAAVSRSRFTPSTGTASLDRHQILKSLNLMSPPGLSKLDDADVLLKTSSNIPTRGYRGSLSQKTKKPVQASAQVSRKPKKASTTSAVSRSAPRAGSPTKRVRSLSPSKRTIPAFYHVQLSEKPVFLRRTTVKPPTLSAETEPMPEMPPSPTRKEIRIVSQATSPTRPTPPLPRQKSPQQPPESVNTANQMSPVMERPKIAVKPPKKDVGAETDETNWPPPEDEPSIVSESSSKADKSINKRFMTWMEQEILIRLLAKKKLSKEKTSSVSVATDPTSNPFYDVVWINQALQSIIDEVLEKELTLMLINLVALHKSCENARAQVAVALIDEVVQEELRKIISEEVQLYVARKAACKAIAQEIIREEVLSQLKELCVLPPKKPSVIVIDVPEMEELPTIEEPAPVIQRVPTPPPAKIEMAMQTSDQSKSSDTTVTTSSKTTALTDLTTISTVLSEGEVFTEFNSEGQLIQKIEYAAIKKTIDATLGTHRRDKSETDKKDLSVSSSSDIPSSLRRKLDESDGPLSAGEVVLPNEKLPRTPSRNAMSLSEGEVRSVGIPEVKATDVQSPGEMSHVGEMSNPSFMSSGEALSPEQGKNADMPSPHNSPIPSDKGPTFDTTVEVDNVRRLPVEVSYEGSPLKPKKSKKDVKKPQFDSPDITTIPDVETDDDDDYEFSKEDLEQIDFE